MNVFVSSKSHNLSRAAGTQRAINLAVVLFFFLAAILPQLFGCRRSSCIPQFPPEGRCPGCVRVQKYRHYGTAQERYIDQNHSRQKSSVRTYTWHVCKILQVFWLWCKTIQNHHATVPPQWVKTTFYRGNQFSISNVKEPLQNRKRITYKWTNLQWFTQFGCFTRRCTRSRTVTVIYCFIDDVVGMMMCLTWWCEN